ncbi:hypothetical protein Acr_05g0012460 [Actinidia rufa]|uniref:Uncharacterized protein n=1 Tax=Actinidia rufa TaxID=165716 RepID=A0A7J0EPW2_9ERIC|nr:hypothetical protein Acr_05g0012460 [Actinidia rufa]
MFLKITRLADLVGLVMKCLRATIVPVELGDNSPPPHVLGEKGVPQNPNHPTKLQKWKVDKCLPLVHYSLDRNELLKNYVKLFNQAILEVEDPSDKVVIMAMMEGLCPGPLFNSLSKNILETYLSSRAKLTNKIAVEELDKAKWRRRGKDHKRKEPNTRQSDYMDEARNKRILRKNQTFQWNEEFKTTFEQLKDYLGSSPLLIVPVIGEELIAYLSISPIAVSAVLIREEDRIQRLIYYVSKILMGAETRYMKIKKLAYALLVAARKIRHYFYAHPIAVLTSQPLKQILQLLENSGRLLKWSIELSEQMEYAIRIGFKATNNEAEYEAFLARLRVAIELGVDALDTFNDSQLVVNRVQGDYLTKNTRMVAYLDEVKNMSNKIKDFTIFQIPIEENKKADALVNLTSIFDFILDRNIPLEFLPSPSIRVAKSVCQTGLGLT